MRAACLLMLVACGSANTSDVERADASMDVGTDAVAIDTGSDVTVDAIPDARTPDLGPDAACTASGCLRSAELIGDFTQDDLQPFLEAGVRIDNGYSVWTLSYATADTESLATVTIPFRARAPIGGYHVVANNHGTTGIGAECGLTGTVYGTGLAGLFGARGMIGVAPDYPGLGTTGEHPYLVAEVEGRAVLDALRAAAQLSDWLSIPRSGRFAATGLSQGGHATLAAAMIHESYAPELDIRAFAAAAPASAWVEHWRGGVEFDGEHLVYHALLFRAWADHYAYDGPSVWAESFDPSVLTSACTFNIRDNAVLGRFVPLVRTELFNAAFLSALSSGEWGEYAALGDYFALNRVVPFPQTAPLRIYQGDADETVLETATSEMVSVLRAGGVDVEYEVVDGGTHLDVAFGYVAANELRTEESLAWVCAQLDD